MNNIYVVLTSSSKEIPFIATSWADARERATKITGTRFRCITIIAPGSELHSRYLKQLGLQML